MSTTTLTRNPCYNPKDFQPNNKFILSKADWALIQMFLVDASNLPLTNAEFPDDAALPIFRIIHDSSSEFHSVTLPKSLELGNSLYNYGRFAGASFGAAVKLMDERNPNKEAIRTIFGRLISTSSQYQTQAGAVFDQTSSYNEVLTKQKFLLGHVVEDEIKSAGGLQTQITLLTNDITVNQGQIQSAQAAILSDQSQIDRTKYYSWIPFVGTIVAIAMIVSANNDIKEKYAKINAAVKAIQGDHVKLDPLNTRMKQLTYAADFNQKLVDRLTGVLPALQKIKGVWGTINTELTKVLENLNQASEWSADSCMSSISLTTAADQWADIANDAHNYMLEFWVQPEQKAA